MHVRTCRLRLAAALALLFVPAPLWAADPPPWLAGYADDAAFAKQIEAIQGLNHVAMREIGQSFGGRPIWAITVGKGEPDTKPAVAIVGSADGAYLLGSELAVRMAENLAKRAQSDDKTSRLLDEYTFYFIPRPDPDTAAKRFRRPWQAPTGNDRSTDDDRDFTFGEDPADDLNDDGIITQMRVADEAGDHVIDPVDARVMVPLDPKQQEANRYRLLSEGREDDGDETFNEDGPGGVAIDHNFPHAYKPFQPHTGEHAASEPETRAVLDFFFDRPNIALVFSFSEDDNLYHPWKPAQGDRERIRTHIQSADATALELILKDYKGRLDRSDAPPSPSDVHGALSEWAYYQYGRWSLAARGWWVPKVEAKEADKSEKQNDAAADAKKSEDKRGADERNLLRWLAREGIDGFVPWRAIDHPDLPGKKVEVGGLKPLVGQQPPAKELGGLAETHLAFVEHLPSYFPKLALTDVKQKPLGGGLYRIEATVLNDGYLPTMPDMGQTNGQNYPLQVQIVLPEGAQLVQGTERKRLSPLSGQGGKSEQTWIVRFNGEVPDKIHLKAWAPAVGTATASVPLERASNERGMP